MRIAFAVAAFGIAFIGVAAASPTAHVNPCTPYCLNCAAPGTPEWQACHGNQ
jgi:hypothetical protein